MQDFPFRISGDKMAYSKGHGAVRRWDKGEGEAEMTENIHKNEVMLTGTVLAPPEYSHSNHEERFFKFPLRILRLSGQADELIVMAGEALLQQYSVCRDDRLHLTGQLRSYNNKSGQGSRLVITVFARTFDSGESEEDQNTILLSGVLCKTPVRRSTPLGREICDMMLAVNRRYGRADYIPCIAWGALAEEIGRRDVGDDLAFEGRVQSRVYHKVTEQGTENRVAYEVSVMCLMEGVN